MPNYSGLTVTGCDTGFVLPSDSSSTFLNARVEKCRVGFLEYNSKELYDTLLKTLYENQSEFDSLKKEVESADLNQKEKDEKIKSSSIFSKLAIVADVVTGYAFLAPLLT